MLASVQSYGLEGIDGYAVCVEANVSGGLPAFQLVGLPDAAVREAQERVRAALANSGFTMPVRRVIINLAPADVRKVGPGYDLPIALAILCASEQLPPGCTDGSLFLGELSMSGELRPVRGALSVAVAALSQGCKRIILPEQNAPELACLQDMEVLPAASLRAVAAHLAGAAAIQPQRQETFESAVASAPAQGDLAQVIGQQGARRALEIAAAGGHSLLMTGPPGSGKTMLARCLPGLLPRMTYAEAMETTRIHSVAGTVPAGAGLMTCRPFRAPHHSASLAALVGGGSDAHPGEITLAHNGVLFLDELPEFPRAVLDGMRQPLEDGYIAVVRANSRAEYPARAMLVASMNPCPCGHYGSAVHACRCTPQQIRRYQGRVSGPLLDRIDLRVEVPAVPAEEAEHPARAETSAQVAARVQAAREMQAARFGESGTHCNAQMSTAQIEDHCALDAAARRLLASAVERLGLSMRGRSRMRKVARTIADLAGADVVGAAHIAEALQYRGGLEVG